MANGCVNLMVDSLESDFYKHLLQVYNQRKKTLKFHETKRNRTLTIKYKFSYVSCLLIFKRLKIISKKKMFASPSTEK